MPAGSGPVTVGSGGAPGGAPPAYATVGGIAVTTGSSAETTAPGGTGAAAFATGELRSGPFRSVIVFVTVTWNRRTGTATGCAR